MKQLKLKQIMKQRDVSFVMNLFLIVWTTEPDMLIKSNNGGKCYAALITFDFSRYFVFISLGFFNHLTFFYIWFKRHLGHLLNLNFKII